MGQKVLVNSLKLSGLSLMLFPGFFVSLGWQANRFVALVSISLGVICLFLGDFFTERK